MERERLIIEENEREEQEYTKMIRKTVQCVRESIQLYDAFRLMMSGGQS